MVDFSIDDHDASLVLSALGYFDEEVFPHSVPRKTLYKLIKYIRDTFGFEEYEGFVSRAPKQFSGEVRTLNLSTDAADYIERALCYAINLGSIEEQLESEYSGGFMREVQRLCSIEAKLREILGPRCFEPSAENKKAWDEVFGVSE
jgi:hypothetical protein